ncbi:hypothetical protein ASG11_12820 [Sphingomonas sp. Leaf357]|uniref:hypothetical protein n=1 Tax=Sphingomonas sp. Leaf357 TaxID=1736350 RepID=UPI0006FE8A77|nr:hypothetical protein [Sphingomonas sp. Leaf357]KQS05023.1 hypothetical protein ASG11_12820 [Sphingomonas sp. Leaf357]
MSQERSPPLTTPDGRYLVVRGRLWRASDPRLADERRADLVGQLMDARRAVAAARRTGDKDAENSAHEAVGRAKTLLGERGPVWWDDDAPDLTRRMARTTPYADWYASVGDD